MFTVNGLRFTDNSKTPLTIDTVRQSIAKAIAKRIMSNILISATKIQNNYELGMINDA